MWCASYCLCFRVYSNCSSPHRLYIPWVVRDVVNPAVSSTILVSFHNTRNSCFSFFYAFVASVVVAVNLEPVASLTLCFCVGRMGHLGGTPDTLSANTKSCCVLSTRHTWQTRTADEGATNIREATNVRRQSVLEVRVSLLQSQHRDTPGRRTYRPLRLWYIRHSYTPRSPPSCPRAFGILLFKGISIRFHFVLCFHCDAQP